MSAVELSHLGPVPGEESNGEGAGVELTRAPLSKKAVALLALQHLSFAWTQRTVEFASVVCLVLLFPDTLLPGALAALVSAASVAVFSGYVGSLVDKFDRLRVVRGCILAVKICSAVVYTALIVLFLQFKQNAPHALRRVAHLSSGEAAAIRALLAVLVISVAIMDLAAVGHNVAFLRDWAVTIADDDTNVLTHLNTILRRVDLVCKLLAPLFVSALTSTLDPAVAVGILLAIAGACFIFEIGWIGVVYRSFPTLHRSRESSAPTEERNSFSQGFHTHLEDWKAFVQMPVFLSSLAVSFLYFTTLSFDGSLINYMLNVRHWQDSFIAGMRGIGVLTGLLGTAVMPYLERKLGLVRAGHWSIWFQVACLLPAVLSFYVGTDGNKWPAWNSAMLLAGVLLSRVGLWSFDLVQLKELQTALDTHPRRNALTGLQYALQSVFGAATSVLTIVVANPHKFGVTALVSFSAVLSGAVCYAAYVKRARRHLFHLYWPLGRKAS